MRREDVEKESEGEENSFAGRRESGKKGSNKQTEKSKKRKIRKYKSLHRDLKRAICDPMLHGHCTQPAYIAAASSENPTLSLHPPKWSCSPLVLEAFDREPAVLVLFHVKQVVLARGIELPPLQARDDGVGAGPVVRVDVQRRAGEAGAPEEKSPPRANLFREKAKKVLFEEGLRGREGKCKVKRRFDAP